MRTPAPATRRLAATVLAVVGGVVALACQPGPPTPSVTGAGAPAMATETAGATSIGATAGISIPCFRVLAMPDERQRRLECANGDRFTLRRAADGQWYPEMKVRAGAVPGYASLDEAGRALCRCS
jgi:hypothetical protein